ncbi:MAG: ATP synthase subunit I [Gammaproteobacteria bacterium]|nr:ATP synthase subunit I [Gammaproteobacteria bacterium]
MGEQIIHPLGRQGWQLACRSAQIQLMMIMVLATVAWLLWGGIDGALSFAWGGAVVILGRWLTALAVFRQAGARYAAVAMRAVLRGNLCTWVLVVCSALLAWNRLQLPPLPFIVGLALVALIQVFMPLIIERNTG